jgi:aa3 type cytochrome c oxidase subunit IV
MVFARGGATIRAQGSGMRIDPSEGHPAMDYAEHQNTYKLFTKLTLYTVAGVAMLMALLYIFVV